MKLAVVFAFALGTFACGGKKSSPTTTTGTSDQMSTMQPAGGSTYGGSKYGGGMFGGKAYGGSKYGGKK